MFKPIENKSHAIPRRGQHDRVVPKEKSLRSTPTWVGIEDLEVTLEGGVPRDDACVVEDGPVTSREVVHQREESCRSESQCNDPHHDLLIFHLALRTRKYCVGIAPRDKSTSHGSRRERCGQDVSGSWRVGSPCSGRDARPLYGSCGVGVVRCGTLWPGPA